MVPVTASQSSKTTFEYQQIEKLHFYYLVNNITLTELKARIAKETGVQINISSLSKFFRGESIGPAFRLAIKRFLAAKSA